MSNAPYLTYAKDGQRYIKTEDYNKIIDATNRYNSFAFDPSSMDYYSDDGRTVISIPSGGGVTTTDTTPWAFGCEVDSDGLVTVNEGTFEAHGAAKIDNPETTIQLTGGPYEYVSISWIRGDSGVTVIHSTSVPTSDGTTIYVPLAKFELTAAPHTYKKILIKHQGDINFDVPLA